MSRGRLLLFTGKGGVGKTTLAAATAATLAEQGRRTLVVSTDPAHSLADTFGVPVGPRPSEVDTRLHAAQIDSRTLVDSAWEELRGTLTSALTGAGVAALEAEELTVLPGVDELLALSEVRRLAATGSWDAVVVDCGPTAETLRLLSLPEAISSYLRRAYGWQPISPKARKVAGTAATVARLGRHLDSLRRVLTDRTVTSVRLVTTPESVVVAETRRTLTALSLRGIRVDGLVANRLLPTAGFWRGGAASWLRTRRAQQDEILARIAAIGMPDMRTVELRAVEPVGLLALTEIAKDLYGGEDPLAGDGDARDLPLLQVFDDAAGHRLRVALPLVEDAEMNLARVDDDLVITIDGFRHLLALPRLLRSCTVTGAQADGEGLVVHLADPERAQR